MLGNLYVKENLSHTGNLHVEVMGLDVLTLEESKEYTFEVKVLSLHSGQELATLFNEYDELVFADGSGRIINIKINNGEKKFIGTSDILRLTGVYTI